MKATPHAAPLLGIGLNFIIDHRFEGAPPRKLLDRCGIFSGAPREELTWALTNRLIIGFVGLMPFSCSHISPI
jgi:hypothetical protein